MKFMITFNHVDGVWDRLSPGEREEHGKWLERFIADLQTEKNAQLVFYSPVAARRTVRKREDGALVTLDGPALPGPEQEGGHYVIEADSMEEAVEWARRGRWLVGSNEVREIFTPPK